mgnify:CR=1 FL=1
MQINEFKEEILNNLNEKEFDRFNKDLDKMSNNQEELSEENILDLEDRFSNMSKEDLMQELQNMFQMKRKPYIRKIPKIGRNELCPCGSGKKYKKCCKEQFEAYIEGRSKDIGDV